MATTKTVGFVSGLGIKCFLSKFRLDIVHRSTPVINAMQVRHARFKASPIVSDDPRKYTGFELSRDPEEWKHVQNLLPGAVIKEPSPKSEYPSGWRPQNPPSDKPYFVQRTANHQLAVYMNRSGPRGQVVRTRVKFVQGDIWALHSDILAMLRRVYPKDMVQTQVNEVAGQIILRGDYASAITEFLKAKGW